MHRIRLTLTPRTGPRKIDAEALAIGLAAGLGTEFYAGAFGEDVLGFVPEEKLQAALDAACRLMTNGFVNDIRRCEIHG